ncbi:MFS transporter [Blautia sp. MSJ-19]|uniref:MFS transporter n=1 Tax=Blautia sp. MSJ-19 TaxID=2841517 RepID=UPI001C0F169E|nr:MFS transporter [Blautia sp. MSJ-19]MBU5480234.1 MFS transporter [Blautia sp. MSJ-19]
MEKKQNLTLRYSLMHFTHWAASTGAVSFATAYLIGRGLEPAAAGFLLALSGLLSCVTQPVLASVADKAQKFVLVKMLLVMSVVSCLALGMQLFSGIPVYVAGIIYMAGIWSADAMVSLQNALQVAYEDAGYVINYGVGRGIGAIASAVSALVAGIVIARYGAVWMVVFLLVFRGLSMMVLAGFPVIQKKTSEHVSEKKRGSSSVLHFFAQYKWYCFSLIAVLFLGMFHAMTENYLFAIMGRLGGDSSHAGVAVFIACIVAFPVIFCYSAIRKHICDIQVMKIAAVSFLIKSVIFYVAPNITSIYFIQLLQITSYALLAPAQVYYARAKVRDCDMVKGQAFMTAAYALGCSCGNFAGGCLLDFGVERLLQAGIAMASAGTLIMFVTADRVDNKDDGNL